MYQMWHCKKALRRIILLIFYVGCFTFVIHRGYKCIGKYSSKPVGVEMSYDFIGDLRFPSFTFCSNNWRNDLSPYKYNQEVLKDCNLSQAQYAFEGTFIGSGSPNCTDPKLLQQKVGLRYDELDIWGIEITTFDRYLDQIQWADISNDSYFEWENSFLDHHRGGCHTISFKESALTHGFLWVRK